MSKLDVVSGVIGAIGGVIAGLLGGWTHGLTILCIFMIIDFLFGIAAAIMNKSHKSENGGISSAAIYQGVLKKVFYLVVVVVGAQLDSLTGLNYIRDTIVIAYIVTETVSIIENAGLMGLPIPHILVRVIDVLKSKNDKKQAEEIDLEHTEAKGTEK